MVGIMNKQISNWTSRGPRRRSRDMLSAEEERNLIRAWQHNGDGAARDRLIRAFAPMAAATAKRFAPGAGEADPDLVQQANLGLMKAADRFDPERGIRFATYAIWWARAEIQAYSWANASVVRRPNSAETRKLGAQVRRLDATLSADPDLEAGDIDRTIAESMGVSAHKLADLRELLNGTDSSLNLPVGAEDGADRMAMLVDPQSVEEEAALHPLDAVVLRRVLIDALAALPSRERDIVMATQLEDPPKTLDCLGTQYGISRERVRQLRERGLERLRDALRKRKLTPDCFV